MLGGGIALGSKPTFSWGWSWTVDEKLCFRAGNKENSKSKISAFQNTKNYLKWLSISEVTNDNVSEDRDEKWERNIYLDLAAWIK